MECTNVLTFHPPIFPTFYLPGALKLPILTGSGAFQGGAFVVESRTQAGELGAGEAGLWEGCR